MAFAEGFHSLTSLILQALRRDSDPAVALLRLACRMCEEYPSLDLTQAMDLVTVASQAMTAGQLLMKGHDPRETAKIAPYVPPHFNAICTAWYKERCRLRARAGATIKQKIRQGKLPDPKTLRCQDCGKPAHEYHHYNGYAKEHWTEVVPLCKKCHTEAHRPADFS